ncbi:hypothetical protein ACFWBC_09730 [Streptomyces sp. NPDC059985]|uniref:hypothetical protein n=1 Tax=Streptomyces sp. NPDC059985 TaxID=3347025 RepID=UPI0036933AC2
MKAVGRAVRVCAFVLFALVSLTMAVPKSANALDFACGFTGDDDYQMDNPGFIESVWPAVKQWEKSDRGRVNDTTGFVDHPTKLGGKPEDYTMYELTGMRGLNWSITMRGRGDASQPVKDKWGISNGTGADQCSIIDFVNNGIADLVIDGTKMLTRVAISIKEYASNPSPFSGLYAGRNTAVDKLKEELFKPAVPLMITLTGIWVFSKWRKNEMREAWAGVGWAALSTVAVIVMLTGRNYNNFIDTADSGIAQANSALSSAVLTQIAGEMTPPCDLPASAENFGARVNSCAIYDTLVFRPWALGQFGSVGTNCIFRNDGGNILEDGRCNPTSNDDKCDWGVKGSARCEDLRIRQLVSQARTNMELGKNLDKKNDNWVPIRYDMAGGFNTDGKKPDQAVYPVAFDEWAGRNAGERIGIAFYSLIAALIVAVMVIALSALTLLWHAVTLIMIIMLPLIATLGIHPSQQKLLKGWLETFIHSFVLRAGFGVILTVLLVLYQMILPSKVSLGMQLLMLLLVTIAVVMMLKKLLSGAYSPKIAGAEDGLGVGDMANTVSSKLGAQSQRLAGNAAAGTVRVAGRAAGRIGGNVGRGADKVLTGGKLQEGGWIAPSNTKRKRRQSERMSGELQQQQYKDMKEGRNGAATPAQQPAGQEGQEGQTPPQEAPAATTSPRRSGRVSAGGAAVPQQGTPPAPTAQTPQATPQAAPSPAPHPAPAPAPAPAPQPAPRTTGRVSGDDGAPPRSPEPRTPQPQTPPTPPHQPPPPRNGDRMPR